MKYGLCVELSAIKELSGSGLDFFEIPLNNLLSKTKEEYDEIIGILHDSPVPVTAANCFFPWGWQVVGKDADMSMIEEYIHKALSEISLLGVNTFTIGNGGARDPVGDMSVDEAYDDFSTVVRITEKYAKKYNVKIGIEALSFNESKICNTLKDTAEYIRKMDLSMVGVTGDLYHIMNNGESFDDIASVSDILVHMHIADNNGRRFPVKYEEYYKVFFDVLNKNGYDKTISIEGKPGDDLAVDTGNAVSLLKRIGG